MSISSGTLTNSAEARRPACRLPEGCSSSSVRVSPNVAAQASNSWTPRSPQRLGRLEPQQGEHLAERVGDRRARGLDQRAAGVLGLDEARFHKQVPGALRAVRIDALQGRAVGGEGELAELLRFIDDDLIDADLCDRQHVVACASRSASSRSASPSFMRSSRLRVTRSSPSTFVGERLVFRDLVLDHAALERGRAPAMKRNATWVMMIASQFAVAARARKRCALVLREVRLVGDQDARVRVELQEFARRPAPGSGRARRACALPIRPSRRCSMIAAAMVKVLPAPTAWAM